MRDIEIKKLRPEIPAIQQDNAVSAAEQFQNETLRPILKFQNELLLAVFKNYIEKRKGVFHGFSYGKKLAYIEQSVRNDLKFRNLLVGLIVGHFTAEEWLTFEKNAAELTRRIVTMLVQRLQSQMDKF